ncbi:MAG: hypothetical protein R3A11_05925 [Bdellovibrionota bacterium]
MNFFPKILLFFLSFAFLFLETIVAQEIQFSESILFTPNEVFVDGKKKYDTQDAKIHSGKAFASLAIDKNLQGELYYDKDYQGGIFLRFSSNQGNIKKFRLSSDLLADAGYASDQRSRITRHEKGALQIESFTASSSVEEDAEGNITPADCYARTFVWDWSGKKNEFIQTDEFFGFDPDIFTPSYAVSAECVNQHNQWRRNPRCEIVRKKENYESTEFSKPEKWIEKIQSWTENKNGAKEFEQNVPCDFIMDFDFPIDLYLEQTEENPYQTMLSWISLVDFSKPTKKILDNTIDITFPAKSNEEKKTLDTITIKLYKKDKKWAFIGFDARLSFEEAGKRKQKAIKPQNIHFEKSLRLDHGSLTVDGKPYGKVECGIEGLPVQFASISGPFNFSSLAECDDGYQGGIFFQVLDSKGAPKSPIRISTHHLADAGYTMEEISFIEKTQDQLLWHQLSIGSYSDISNSGEPFPSSCFASTKISEWNTEKHHWKEIDHFYGFDQKIFAFENRQEDECFTQKNVWRGDANCQLERRQQEATTVRYKRWQDFIEQLRLVVEKQNGKNVQRVASCNFDFDFQDPWIMQPSKATNREMFDRMHTVLGNIDWNTAREEDFPINPNAKLIKLTTKKIDQKTPIYFFPDLPELKMDANEILEVALLLLKNPKEKDPTWEWRGYDLKVKTLQ